jgi:hypothetical protein
VGKWCFQIPDLQVADDAVRFRADQPFIVPRMLRGRNRHQLSATGSVIHCPIDRPGARDKADEPFC